MKIGIISFHNAANHGASLQAYALLKFIEDNGYDCEYIDYQNEFRRKNYSFGRKIINRFVLMPINAIYKIIIFILFCQCFRDKIKID